MREVGPVRKGLDGDEAVSAAYMSQARMYLGMLKVQMAPLKIQVLSRTINLSDGTTIYVASIFGQDVVRITVPAIPGAPAAEPAIAAPDETFIEYAYQLLGDYETDPVFADFFFDGVSIVPSTASDADKHLQSLSNARGAKRLDVLMGLCIAHYGDDSALYSPEEGFVFDPAVANSDYNTDTRVQNVLAPFVGAFNHSGSPFSSPWTTTVNTGPPNADSTLTALIDFTRTNLELYVGQQNIVVDLAATTTALAPPLNSETETVTSITTWERWDWVRRQAGYVKSVSVPTLTLVGSWSATALGSTTTPPAGIIDDVTPTLYADSFGTLFPYEAGHFVVSVGTPGSSLVAINSDGDSLDQFIFADTPVVLQGDFVVQRFSDTNTQYQLYNGGTLVITQGGTVVFNELFASGFDGTNPLLSPPVFGIRDKVAVSSTPLAQFSESRSLYVLQAPVFAFREEFCGPPCPLGLFCVYRVATQQVMYYAVANSLTEFDNARDAYLASPTGDTLAAFIATFTVVFNQGLPLSAAVFGQLTQTVILV
jgi:hypothetical protein